MTSYKLIHFTLGEDEMKNIHVETAVDQMILVLTRLRRNSCCSSLSWIYIYFTIYI